MRSTIRFATVRTALAAALLLGTTAATCRPPAPPHPATSETRYTCCNIYYEQDEIPDTLWKVGTMIPLGTPVRIQEVRGDSIKFEASGHRPITLVLKYGKGAKSIDQYLDEMFPLQNPRTRLAKMKPKTQKAIESGMVEEGMTREQVKMSMGVPAAHRTPSLDAPQWYYWQNRWHQIVVSFEGDKVTAVQR
jgi:hypothetical protein